MQPCRYKYTCLDVPVPSKSKTGKASKILRSEFAATNLFFSYFRSHVEKIQVHMLP